MSWALHHFSKTTWQLLLKINFWIDFWIKFKVEIRWIEFQAIFYIHFTCIQSLCTIFFRTKNSVTKGPAVSNCKQTWSAEIARLNLSSKRKKLDFKKSCKICYAKRDKEAIIWSQLSLFEGDISTRHTPRKTLLLLQFWNFKFKALKFYHFIIKISKSISTFQLSNFFSSF